MKKYYRDTQFGIGIQSQRDCMLVENITVGGFPSQSLYVKGFGAAAVQTFNLAAMKIFAELLFHFKTLKHETANFSCYRNP